MSNDDVCLNGNDTQLTLPLMSEGDVIYLQASNTKMNSCYQASSKLQDFVGNYFGLHRTHICRLRRFHADNYAKSSLLSSGDHFFNLSPHGFKLHVTTRL